MTWRPAGVRTRTTIAVAVAAFVVSTLMALLTFQLTRAYLTAQRDRLATRQAYLNARLLQDVLPGGDAETAASTLGALSLERGSQALLYTDDRWLGSSVGLSEEAVPPEVLEWTTSGRFTRQRVEIAGTPQVVVGIPLLDGRAEYFEFFPLLELQRTLRTMSISLTASAIITTIAGAAFGASLSHRVLRPLAATSSVARRIAGGETELRLPRTADRQLAPLYESFNDMVDALAERVERERRFAADVSHELRTPLTALLSAASILERQHDSLPERAQLAAEIMSNQLEHFRGLVLDLLDMSRMESGADVAQLDWVDIRHMVERLLAARSGATALDVAGCDGPILTDGRRIERVLTNLLDNADRYAGGAVRVAIRRCAGLTVLTVDDAGPGVDPAERQAIFERLHRGDAARATGESGNGLGLALAAEHVRLLGGTIIVDGSPESGARFIVRLPDRVEEPPC
ncbi:MAG: HAMP domain-containing histidine kinase [Acidimicrobiales bacterium]|nr:HAMP domain-containing histidine kinase [Acidimicrobiales bacterium]